ncbi:MAG TPA: alpha-2-macroglobulin family protein [Ferruginibacter sp.]|nr:alpha-2-macroglobulin family protein [Ferruginibacter sp.]
MFFRKLFWAFFLLTGFSLSLFAQKKDDYVQHWKKVEELEKKGLTRSALQEVMVIYTLAIAANNDAQQIKSAMYQVKYRNMVEEDSRENNIFFVDTLISKAKGPAKNILQSMHAEMFWHYLRNNRWKFYGRTQLAEEKSKDITTWSIDKLNATITKLYTASLQNENLLKTTKLDGLDAIIIKGENTRHLRPTLYDFLAHRALEYFMNDESGVTKPAYEFKLSDNNFFAPATDFIKLSLLTRDTASLQQKALLIFRDLLKFHIADADPAALIDADLLRLKFVNNYGVMENKEKLYEAALKTIEEKYPNNLAVAKAMYLRGMIYYNRGQDYDAFTKADNQYEIKRAKELFETAFAKFPKSEGGVNAKNMIVLILQPSLNLETEKVNVPLQPFRTLVKYKNVKTIYLRIIKTSRNELKDNNNSGKIWKSYTAMKPVKSWSVSLPDPQDYQQHATEIKIDGQPNGIYIILASLDEGFSLSKNIIAKQLTYVSNISYVNNYNSEYYVLNRDNGQPLANAQVQLWERVYNYSSSKYEALKAEKYTTDQTGFFKLKESKDYRGFSMQINHGTDELFMDDEHNGYNTYNSIEPVIKPQAFLFTDRSIYRPGQTIYFKGIVIKKENDVAKTAIVAGFKTKIFLKDANNQKAGELTVTTNEFGSYKGSFRLPEGSMNGSFSLIDSVTNASYSFSVEEYKRPNFFAEIQKPKGTYRVHDSIHITGTAKAYAGNNIDGAKVSYRVVRKVRYPIWWEWGFYKRFPVGPAEQTEVANGITTTDAKGEFKIHFKALPDEDVDKKSQPTFYYEVSADITDINGETRSANTTVAVAYQSLKLDIDMPEKIPGDSLKAFRIRSSNLNDIFEKATINVTFTRVKSPDRIFRDRYWQIPDQFVMSKDEYYTYFPHDAYKDEDKIQNWPLAEKFLDKTDSTRENGNWPLPVSGWQPGWYKIVATTKDKYGEDVKAEKYIRITGDDANDKVAEPITVDVIKRDAEPGDKISYSMKSGFSNVWIIQAMSRMGNNGRSGHKNIASVLPIGTSVEVTEADRGGMAMSYVFVKHNRVYKGTEQFNIPWSNKELNISYETFRDKLLPGSREKWKVKISGNKGEKVAAEMLAGMYDASLDQFKPHSWNRLDIWPVLSDVVRWIEKGFNAVNSEEYDEREFNFLSAPSKSYDGLLGSYTTIRLRGEMTRDMRSVAPSAVANQQLQEVSVARSQKSGAKERDGSMVVADTVKFNTTVGGEVPGINQPPNEAVQIRKNFNETAFFFPDLLTDAQGNVEFSFTMPEALTQWKLMTLAHTKDGASGYITKSLVTQKPLMVQPNAPRFMREGDRMEFSAKIVNMGETEVTGTAQLELLDAATNKPIDGWFKNVFPNQYFTVAAGQSEAVKFPIEIPFNFNSAVTYRIVAKAGNHSDGEEMAIPVLTNRMLVTETMPINLRGVNSKEFKFEKLLKASPSGGSQREGTQFVEGPTLTNHALTVEYTSNPAWYAVQALPYLMEYPYECAEQTFNKYYANTLASYISNSNPKIKAVFSKWLADSLKASPTGGGLEGALLSNLQKNEELKSALLQETPWVLEAQNENQQKKNIALLFDMVRMSNEQTAAFNKLKEMQSSNGGFTWFKGGPDDRYMTQYITTGIGHLRKLNALTGDHYQTVKVIVDKAIPYLDKKIKEEYDQLIKNKAILKNNNLSYTAIQYLYMRSFFTEYKIAAASQTAYNYYNGQAKKFWLSNSKYMQAMIALALHRSNDGVTPKAIIKSLKENAINKEELGMYWKEWTTGGYYWHQAPIESQAMMIEAFIDIDKNVSTVDDLKTWLLKQKQTQNWRTTKATAEACYALLLGGTNWLAEEKEVTISLGNTTIKSTDNTTESGTGYFKKRIEGEKVKPQMGNITVSVTSAGSKVPPPAGGGGGGWGSVYWQYFEDLDKITSAETPLKLKKQLFIEKNSDKGPVLVALGDGAELKVGDKIKVRIELKVDRDMEYVHMKDMRAACMEPTNVISQYKYQGGLGYYESTKDASTNFFFGWLARGSYVFEYPMFVTHAGNFSNGITTIQCMYAPEFTSHSEGIRVNVE